MKSKTPYLLLIAGLSACQQPSKQAANPIAAPPKNHLQGYPNGSPLVQSYGQYLTTLDTTDLTSSKAALREFKQRFTGQPPEVCDTGFVLFFTLLSHINTDTNVNKIIGNYTMDTLAEAEEMGTALSALGKKKRRTLEENFFIVHEDEGQPYLLPGWRLMPPQFDKYVTRPMKEVVDERIEDEQEGFENDGGLTMAPRQLARRTIWWEGFPARYAHHIYAAEAKNTYNVLLNIMVRGTDNTSLTDFDSAFRMSTYFDTAYSLIHDSFPASRTNAVLTPYRQALEARDSVTMARVRDSIGKLAGY